MNCHEVLLRLTTSTIEEAENFDDKLQRILENVRPQLSSNVSTFVNDGDSNKTRDLRLRYLRTLVSVLKTMQEESDDEAPMSVSQFKTIKVAVELVTSIGIIPCLLPGVGVDMAKLCPRATVLCEENIDDLQKYRRLSFSASALADLYKDLTFRPAVLSQLGPLLAALLQLHHAPLMKPTADDVKPKNQFVMTTDLYNTLKADQEEFGSSLNWFFENCPQSMIIKELMVILGIKGSPGWLRRPIREHLVKRLMQPTGVLSVIAAVCEDTLDLGEHWNKLDTVARLIATTHGRNDYYKAICPQILDLLSSKQIKHGATMANCCITALYDYAPNACVENIVNVICAPLLEAAGSEEAVEECIERLTRTFLTVEAKHLPCKLMSHVALPLFSLYNNVRESACVLKTKLKQLLLRLLDEFRSSLFAACLGHAAIHSFGTQLASKFGPTGGIEIVGSEANPNYKDFADTLMDLVVDNETLSSDLFAYLLKFLSSLSESSEDAIERIEKELSSVKLLSNLASTSVVQEAQMKKPDELFAFIKSLFDDYVEKNERGDDEILYVSLMLVKMILSEKRPSDWRAFDDFARHIKGYRTRDIPEQLLSLIQEVVSFIERRSEKRNYQDLSVNPPNKFGEALRDLADPLLPVRAHGLITLTKLIEGKDPCTLSWKAIVLRMFEENLKHEDSFIYLAAINGFCALATAYPEKVLQTLVQEFVKMPQRVFDGSITSETRMKLGEILVKTTRALGEMATPHKDLLVNGFLYATKDADPLVRASSLSCLGELCKVLGFRLGNIVIEVIYCITCIVKSDKAPECRRAAVLVATLLLRGLGKDTLSSLGKDLLDLYRGLKHLRDNDQDPVLRLHAQLALEELDSIVRDFMFSTPKLEKRIFLLEPR